MNQKYYDNLKESSLFNNVDDKIIKRLLISENIMKYKKGDDIISSNNSLNGVGILLKGNAVLKHGTSEDKTVIIGALGESDVLGVNTVFSKDKNVKFTAQARSTSSVLFIKEEELMNMFVSDSNILNNYLHIVNDKMNLLSKKIEAYTASSAEEKLAVYLLEHAETDGKKYFVNLEFSITKLANIIDLGRASLYRAFDTLENNYVIMKNKKSINILDYNKLKKLCNK